MSELFLLCLIFGMSSCWYNNLTIDCSRCLICFGLGCLLLPHWDSNSYFFWLLINHYYHEQWWRPYLPTLRWGYGHHWPAAQDMEMRIWCMYIHNPPIRSIRLCICHCLCRRDNHYELKQLAAIYSFFFLFMYQLFRFASGAGTISYTWLRRRRHRWTWEPNHFPVP